ncbi:MAG: A/G-specific adenine glycosylase [Flavisolibacter sp.]
MSGTYKSKKRERSSKEELDFPEFTQDLLKWNHRENFRQMPWKGEKDFYKIWISEIILQQTRVEQGLKYYQNFISQFPDVHALARASEDEVFKCWEGLGYYSRCRNLITTARYISNDLEGNFPEDYESILKLKGIGPYTAAALASFAYNLPFAVLDGNVFRVLARISGNDTPIDSQEGKKFFASMARDLLPAGKAGIYNQAIMDFGATVCKPVPVCSDCFYRKYCKAFLSGKQDLLPVKEKSIKQKSRWMHYFFLDQKEGILIRKRSGNDVWQDLHEFLLVETPGPLDESQLYELFSKQYGFPLLIVSKAELKQKLTHQQIHFCFYQINAPVKKEIPGFFWVKKKDLGNYAFPKSLQQYLQNQLK